MKESAFRVMGTSSMNSTNFLPAICTEVIENPEVAVVTEVDTEVPVEVEAMLCPFVKP